MDLDWRVVRTSALFLLAVVWLLGTIFWPLGLFVFVRWGVWVWRGARAEALAKRQGQT